MKSAVAAPAQDDREKSGVFAVISTLPMRSAWRRRTPVEVASQIVEAPCSANPNVCTSA